MPALKTVILFEEYSIAVSMNKATVDTDIQLHEYHNEDMWRTCRKTFCSGCGKTLTAEDIVKGYEYEDGRLVLLSKDDLRQIRGESDNAISIICSALLEHISPIYFSTSYFAVPDTGSEAVFEAFRLALLEEQKILLGRSVLGGLDSLVAVIPIEDGMIITKLHHENDINKMRKEYKKPMVPECALESVKLLLNDMYSTFDISAYENEFQRNLRNLIASKIAEGIDTYEPD